MRRYRTVRWLVASWVLMSAARPASAAMAEPSEEQYLQVQTAFLQEQFGRVVELVGPMLQPASGEPVRVPRAGTGRAPRVWLWYALSLDRLQRSTEALEQIDQLRQQLWPDGTPASALRGPASELLPEVLFWDGEISRKAFQIMRARRAYQRLLAQFPTSSWRAQTLLGLAFVQFHQQSYEEALQSLQDSMKATTNASTIRQARLLEGLCDLQLKRFEQAETRFEALLRDAKDTDPALRAQLNFYLGEAHSGAGQYAEAIPAYLRAIEPDPDSAWARFGRFGIGWSFFQQHRCRDSLTVLNSSGRPDPSWPRAESLFAQGECFVALHDQDHAVQRFQELRKAAPNHPLAIEGAITLAQLLEQRRQLAQARTVLEPLLTRSLSASQAQRISLRLGSIALAQGQSAQAAEAFALALKSNDPDVRQAALNGQGDLAAFLGNTEPAIRAYEEAARMGSTREAGLYATYQLGRLRLQRNELDQAIAAFRQVTEQAGPALSGDAHLALAYAYLSNGQPDLARVELDTIRQRPGASAEAIRAGYYLALMALREGRIPDVKSLGRDVIKRAPQSDEAFEAQLLLADLEASQNSPDAALSSLQTSFAQRSSGSADEPMLTTVQRGRLVDKLGDLAYQAGRYAQAIRWYEAARDLLPAKRAELDYRMASCYEEAGDVPTALRRYQAITQSPWSIRGSMAAAKLLEREERWREAMAIYRDVMRQSVPEAKVAEERLAALRDATNEAVGRQSQKAGSTRKRGTAPAPRGRI